MVKLNNIFDVIKDDIKIYKKKKQTNYQRAAKELSKKKTIKKLRVELFDKFLVEEVLSQFIAPPGFWREIVAQKTNYVIQQPCVYNTGFQAGGYINTAPKEYIAAGNGDMIDVTDSSSKQIKELS